MITLINVFEADGDLRTDLNPISGIDEALDQIIDYDKAEYKYLYTIVIIDGCKPIKINLQEDGSVDELLTERAADEAAGNPADLSQNQKGLK